MLGSIYASAQTEAARYIEEFNREEVHFVGKPKNKTAKILFCQCRLLPGSEVADELVELRLVSKASKYTLREENGLLPGSQNLKVIVRNKSNRVLYIDLGNSFFTRGIGSECLYVPKATSNSTSSSSGISVGVVGGAAVGGSSVNTTSTTVYSQRILAVPPMSDTVIGEFRLFTNDDKSQYDGNVTFANWDFGLLNLRNEDKPLIGEEKVIQDDRFIRFGAFFTYATDEAQTEPRLLNAAFCLSKIIGGYYNPWVCGFPESDISPNYTKTVFFLCYVSDELR